MSGAIDSPTPFLAAYSDGFQTGWRLAMDQFEALFIAHGNPDGARFVRETRELTEAQWQAMEAAAQGRRPQ